VLTCGVCVIIIIYYTYIIIYYYYSILYYYYIILYSSSPLPLFLLICSFLPTIIFSSSLPIPFSIPPTPQYSFYTCRYLHILIYIILFLISSSSLSPLSSHSSYIHSILVGTYIYLFIFYPLLIHSILVGTYIYLFIFNQNNSTPHVLSEWMVEV
jgi:hypothetical protein